MAAMDTTRTTLGDYGLVGRFVGLVISARTAFEAWNDARATRNSLSELTDRELEDIGLIRGDIDAVAEGRHQF